MQNDFEFATGFALQAGSQIVRLRATTGRRKKLDRTDVTDADELINIQFIEAVERREGRNAAVRGEERSARVAGATRVWTLDPIDGTGEYVDDSIPHRQRTTCIGISLFVSGRLMLAVVHNPFRNETFVAGAGSDSRLNGRPIVCSTTGLRRGVAYDYCYWDGASFDARGLERRLGRPRGVYSAIYQACEVAAGRSEFTLFPGDTIHDIAPGALLLERANGRVTDRFGNPLDWNDLSRAALFANRIIHPEVVRLLATL